MSNPFEEAFEDDTPSPEEVLTQEPRSAEDDFTEGDPPKEEVTEPTSEELPQGGEPQPGAEPSKPEDGQPDPQGEGAQNTQVPLGALETERDKRKSVQAEFDQYKAEQEARFQAIQGQLAALAQTQPQQQQPSPPDPGIDPEGYVQFHREQTERAMRQQMLGMSHTAAVRHYGQEKVQEADQELKAARYRGEITDQQIMAMQSQPDPYGALMQWRQQRAVQTQLAQYGHDLDKFALARAAELQQGSQPATNPQPQPSPTGYAASAYQPAQPAPAPLQPQTAPMAPVLGTPSSGANPNQPPAESMETFFETQLFG